MVEAKCQGASRWVVQWVDSRTHSKPQPSPSGRSCFFKPGKKILKTGGGGGSQSDIFFFTVGRRGRVGGHIVFERYRDVDDLARHVAMTDVGETEPCQSQSTQRHCPGANTCRLIGLRVRKSTIRSSTRNIPTWCQPSSPSSAARCWRAADVSRSWRAPPNSPVSS